MQPLRNVAIVAHVDHGKTTLVDKILEAGRLLREGSDNEALVLDNNELERERGITIVSKNVSVRYKGVKINLIDTPGHADFGGEVERVLKLADGVLLLVDAFEGVMPQTRFVLQKALGLGLVPIVVINKLDKPNCDAEQAHEQVFELMCQLEASEAQLEFATLYGSSKQGWMSLDPTQPTSDITALLDTMLERIPAPQQRSGSAQFQITSLDYSSFLGRIAIGRLYQGSLQAGKAMTLCKADGSQQRVKVKSLELFEGLGRQQVEQADCGELCAVAGLEGFEIGDTLTDSDDPQPLPRIAVDEPTMSMLFTINTSPLAGQEGKLVTSRHLRERLLQETEQNLALRVQPTESEDKFLVFGRGILHLSILIETMRRQGYELQVGQPQVLFKQLEGKRCEPIEELIVEVPEAYAGKVIELVSQQKGTMTLMEAKGDHQHLEFDIPSRGLMGLRSPILTATAGTAVMNHRVKGYEPYRGALSGRNQGALIAMEAGQVTAYALGKLQDRGTFFVAPGQHVYEGQVVGAHTRPNDLVVNLSKGKKLTNMRASGSDEQLKVAPAKVFQLEEGMEYLQADEYLEITPTALRLRKIHLKEKQRKRHAG